MSKAGAGEFVTMQVLKEMLVNVMQDRARLKSVSPRKKSGKGKGRPKSTPNRVYFLSVSLLLQRYGRHVLKKIATQNFA